jgi:hypothetical protein
MPPEAPRVDESSLVDVEGPWVACKLDALIPLGIAHRLRQTLTGDDLAGFVSRALIDAVHAAQQADVDAELMAPVTVPAVLPVTVLDWLTTTFVVPSALEQFVSGAIVAAYRKGGAA